MTTETVAADNPAFSEWVKMMRSAYDPTFDGYLNDGPPTETPWPEGGMEKFFSDQGGRRWTA